MLLEEVELNKIFYINSLNIGNELIIYLTDSGNSFPKTDKNYFIYEIEDQFFIFNSSIDGRIKEEIQVNIDREYSINNYILYKLNINYADNRISYLFFR